jgi:DNA-binding MarR family transcriptional regulator
VTEPQLARLLLAAHRTLSAELVDELDERGWPDLRASQAALVLNVDRRFGTRLTELARRAGVTKQAMMIVVDELEVRGLVRRTPDPDDGRAKVVRLTARGRTFAAECRRAVAAVEARARRDLGGRRYDGLRETLDMLLGSEEDEAS